jgi:hypothetical protein
VEFFSGHCVSINSFAHRFKEAQMILNSITPYRRSPLTRGAVKSNALVARGVAFDPRYVLHVLSFCSRSDIFPSIIGRIFVDMVNLMRWPFTCLANPNKYVRLIRFASKTYVNSPFFFFRSRPGQFSRWPSTGTYAPSQLARFWAIMKILANDVWARFRHMINLNNPCRNVNVGSFN